MLKYILIKMHKQRKKPIFIILILCGIIAAIIAIVFFATSGCSKTLPEGKTAEVTIEQGSSTSNIADKMSKAGVVENPAAFMAAVTGMGAEASLKAGTYIFEGGKSVQEYVEILCDGPDKYSPKVVVVEGMRIKSIAEAVEKATDSRIKAKEFIDATSDTSDYVKDHDFLKEVGHKSLEGFLFPKTYAVSSKDSARDIVERMLDQFVEETKDLNFDYPKSQNLTLWEAVTLASIVEKESADGVRDKVASVFYNRLKNGMYINSDATTAYEVGHDPTPEEVHAQSPYSTYTNYGLPPTPICSPGLEALRAVCFPTQTNYLYFVFKADKNGEMQYRFSENFDDHQQAIIDLGLV